MLIFFPFFYALKPILNDFWRELLPELFEDILFPLSPISIIDFIKDIGKREKESLENLYNWFIFSYKDKPKNKATKI